MKNISFQVSRGRKPYLAFQQLAMSIQALVSSPENSDISIFTLKRFQCLLHFLDRFKSALPAASFSSRSNTSCCFYLQGSPKEEAF